MFDKAFGIEIEFTGITREQAAKVVAEFLNGTIHERGGVYDAREITAPDGRVWKIVRDSSVYPQTKENGEVIDASDLYKVELVSPILTYREDIETVQELVRRLRHAGGLTNGSTGIHCHLNGADHTPRSVRNFVNIIASRNDLLYKALQIEPDRMRYCKKMDSYMVDRLNRSKPKTFEEIEEIWYEGYNGYRDSHYHESRYQFCNLHALFHGHHTLELRAFNSTLHAGVLRSYIVLALALNNQVLTQRSASPKKCQE